MIFSSRPRPRSVDHYNKHIIEHINYVIRQCVLSNTSLMLLSVSEYNTQYIYKFECNEIPSYTLLNLLSIYFDSMSIDVCKEYVRISLTIDLNKNIPF